MLLCPARRRFVVRTVALLGCTDLIGGCAAAPAAVARPGAAPGAALDAAGVLDRIGWGATSSEYQRIRAAGTEDWIAGQLRPDAQAPMAPEIQAQIDAMSIERTPMPELVFALEAQRKDAEAMRDDAARKAALHDVQLELSRLGREASLRQLLRAVYSPKPLQEQMTWFWSNHFSVYQHKHMIGAMLGDYERRLRGHALGRFPRSAGPACAPPGDAGLPGQCAKRRA